MKTAKEDIRTEIIGEKKDSFMGASAEKYIFFVFPDGEILLVPKIVGNEGVIFSLEKSSCIFGKRFFFFVASVETDIFVDLKISVREDQTHLFAQKRVHGG